MKTLVKPNSLFLYRARKPDRKTCIRPVNALQLGSDQPVEVERALQAFVDKRQ